MTVCHHHSFLSPSHIQLVLLAPTQQALEAQTQRLTQELARLQTTNSEVQGTSKTVCVSLLCLNKTQKEASMGVCGRGGQC